MRLIALSGFAVLLSHSAMAGAAATAQIIDSERRVVGHADFQSTGHGVLIEIAAKGLKPGPHAILLHSSAACDPATGFATAGPILSFEADRPHGYLTKGGPRAGDLPTQYAANDGTLHATLTSSAFTLGNGYKSLFDADGASLVIHAKGDDYLSQPEGNAGERIACGPVIRTVPPGPHKGRKHR